MNGLLNRGVSKYYQCSCALFDEDNNLLFQSKNFLSFLRVDEPMGEILFPADDYLSPEELREFASLVYQYQTHLPGRSGYLSSQEGASPEGASPEEYAHKHWRISLVLAKETNIPVRLTVQELNLNGEEHEDSDETGEAHEAVDETEEALEIADETGKTDEVPEAVDETASDADTRSPSAPEDSLSFSDVPWDHSTVVWVWQNRRLSPALPSPISPTDTRTGLHGRKMNSCRICSRTRSCFTPCRTPTAPCPSAHRQNEQQRSMYLCTGRTGAAALSWQPWTAIPGSPPWIP